VEKIRIREHIPDDLEEFVEWQTDPEYGKYISWLPRSQKEAKKHFEKSIINQTDNKRSQYFFAVVDSDSGEYLGDVGFTLDDKKFGDCGWFIRKRYKNLGIATKAVKELIRFAFLELNLSKLTASCLKSNVASMRIMEKCGFTQKIETKERIWYVLKNLKLEIITEAKNNQI